MIFSKIEIINMAEHEATWNDSMNVQHRFSHKWRFLGEKFTAHILLLFRRGTISINISNKNISIILELFAPLNSILVHKSNIGNRFSRRFLVETLRCAYFTRFLNPHKNISIPRTNLKEK